MSTFDVRAAADRVCDYYVPSSYPDEVFLDLIDGHWQPGGGTTCSYLTAKILVLLGCRAADFVNHDDPEGLGRIRFEFGDTRNGVAKLVAGAKALGCWVADAAGVEPVRMDLAYMTVPGNEGLGDHVEVFRTFTAEGAWEAAAAGQGTRERQTAAIVTRTVDDRRASGGGRWLSSSAGQPKRLMGWADLSRVPLVEPPSGPAVEPEPSQSPSQVSRGALVLGGLLLLAGASLGWYLHATKDERRVFAALRRAEMAYGMRDLATVERARRLAQRGAADEVVAQIGKLSPAELERL